MAQAVKPSCFFIILSSPSKSSYLVVHKFVVPVASHCLIIKLPFLKAAMASDIKSSYQEDEGRERSPEREGSMGFTRSTFPSLFDFVEAFLADVFQLSYQSITN